MGFCLRFFFICGAGEGGGGAKKSLLLFSLHFIHIQ